VLSIENYSDMLYIQTTISDSTYHRSRQVNRSKLHLSVVVALSLMAVVLGLPSSSDALTRSPEKTRAWTFTTPELRSGQPLEQFPFPIMTDPPHSYHEPVTGFARATMSWTGSRTFYLPTVTNHLGLYGQFWMSPRPPLPGARLVGVKIVRPSWSGTTDNSLVVFSLLDTATQDNALGSVSGAYTGIAGQLVGVLFEQSSSQITLKLSSPVPNSNRRFVLAIDSENLPTGNTNTVYPDSISVARIVWTWSI